MTRFLHTADWQIGKPFGSVEDPAKREALRRQRIDTVRSLGPLIQREQLDFVVVCGDLFDSATPDKAAVSALCSAVGELAVPVYAIPGNHDHGGPGCIWRQEFFLREQEQLAPNFHMLLESEPVLLEKAVLLPCPLFRRHESTDPTAWLRSEPEGLPGGLPRIVLAHGSTQGFSSSGEADQESAVNRLDLDQLPAASYDYIALGDWHGMKQVAASGWFCGTPEQDRFAKGDDNLPGHVLVVEIPARGSPPAVTPVAVGRIGWHGIEPIGITGDDDLETVKTQVAALIGNRTGQDLLKLDLRGTLSFEGAAHLGEWVESLQARLLRLKIDREIKIEPTPDELAALTGRQDPLIAQVARELRDSLDSDPLARDALRELHLEVVKEEGGGWGGMNVDE
ncbi:MAG: exonuclease SbcCD subunit D [Puniceicoccaceae bacterium]